MKIKVSPHRIWTVSSAPWLYYQEWNQVIFLHWEIPQHILRALVPNELKLDNFEGKYWVSLVAFSMEKAKFRFLPSFPPISDFHEVNVRTYVLEDGKPGVYFLSIEGSKTLSNFIARKMSGLPYEKATIIRKKGSYNSLNSESGCSLVADYTIGNLVVKKDELDIWLSERYSLYLCENGHKFRYEIDHEEWQMNQVAFEKLDLNYKLGDFLFPSLPNRCHFSNGVKVLAWAREKII